MKELDKTYNPSEIEGRIYDKWTAESTNLIPLRTE